MSEAPKTIWAVTEPNDESAQILGDVYAQQVPDGMVGKPTKYLRADIVAAQLKAAVMAERQACAAIADYAGAIQHPADGSYAGSDPVMGPDIAAAIRARTTQEGET